MSPWLEVKRAVLTDDGQKAGLLACNASLLCRETLDWMNEY